MSGRIARDLSPRLGATIAGLLLFGVYAASAAPDVTFWDAGEFLTAFATFGVPHPPGTPLFVAVGRVWTLVAATFGADTAHAGNLLSATCTAAAGACTAWLVARWTRSPAVGIAAALCAGTMATVWANATETEVYAASLLLACLALVAGEHAGTAARASGGRVAGSRASTVTAYTLALAVPVHLSVLVASPAALCLACVPGRDALAARFARVSVVRATALLSAVVLAAGVGAAHAALVLLGVLGFVASFALARYAGSREHRLGGEVAAIAGATVLGLSATFLLLLRARHDPLLNQADPATWRRLVEAIGRRQYAVAGLWPRQAPWWLQIANLGEWADWQVALGLGPGAEPNWRRTPLTGLFVLLGMLGSLWHWRRDRRSWTAVLLLLVAGSVGVACYLNLKAGPSFGVGVLPESAPHEARERDYFFTLAWWAWGIWAGMGAVAAAARLTREHGRNAGRAPVLLGIAVAASPVLFNWHAVSRADRVAGPAAAAYARAVLENAPPRAVLVVNGDNDTYPLWQAQTARRIRRDVTTVTVSLLPARWYRAELARRAWLLPARVVDEWLGPSATLAAIRERAAQMGRPIAVTLATDDTTRAALAMTHGGWELRGLTLAWGSDVTTASAKPGRGAVHDSARITLAPSIAASVGTAVGDRSALTAAAARAPRIAPAWLRDSTGDGVVAWAYRQLACPAAALAGPSVGAPAGRPRSLEWPCQAR